MSAASLMFVVMDWWIGYWTVIVRQRAKHGLVVFDVTCSTCWSTRGATATPALLARASRMPSGAQARRHRGPRRHTGGSSRAQNGSHTGWVPTAAAYRWLAAETRGALCGRHTVTTGAGSRMAIPPRDAGGSAGARRPRRSARLTINVLVVVSDQGRPPPVRHVKVLRGRIEKRSCSVRYLRRRFLG